MPNIISLSEYQSKVVYVDHRINVVGHSAGSGTTFALMVAAIRHCTEKDNTKVTFITTYPNGAGGVCEKIKELLKRTDFKFSDMSLIVTFSNGSKIKFLDHRTMSVDNLSGEFVLIDSGVPDDIIVKILPKSSKIIISDFLCDMLAPNSWARNLRLISDSGFSDLVNYIPASGANLNYPLVKQCPSYLHLLEKLPPSEKDRLTRTEFTNKYAFP